MLVIKQAVKSWLSTCLILPLCISLIFYTLWPISEQIYFGVVPLQGTELSEQSLWELGSLNLMTLLSALSFAFLLNKFSSSTKPEFSRQTLSPSGSHGNFGTFGLLFLGIAGLLYSTDFAPNRLSDYEENMVASYFSVWIPISKALISYACALRFLQLVSQRTEGDFIRLPLILLWPRTVFWFSIPCFLAVLTSDKDPFLPLASAVLYLLAPSTKRLHAIPFTACVLAGCLFSQFCLLYFSVIRGGGNFEDLLARLRQNDSAIISITASDPGGPYVSLSHQFNLGLPDSFKFELVERLLSIVPQHFLDSKRPDTLDTAYAKFMMQRFDAGNGLGFHPLAQASLDFGIWLSWTYLSLIFVFGFLPLFIVTRFSKDNTLIMLLGLIVSSAFIISHRMPIESTFKSVFTYTLLLTPAYLVSRFICEIVSDLFRSSISIPIGVSENSGGSRASQSTL